MPSRFDSAPPKSAAFFFFFVFFFVSNSLYHSTLIRPLSTVILSSLLRTTFQTLPWTLHLYIKFTDFQWNWFCTHLLSLLLELDAKLYDFPLLSDAGFLPSTCRVPPILQPFLRFYQITLEDHTWHESLNILVGATTVLKKGLSKKKSSKSTKPLIYR